MATDEATEKLLGNLQRMLERMNGDLDRVEILTGALRAFSRPVPDYEPIFQNLKQLPTPAQELRSGD